ncbi:hypothetical protein [Paraburkholderia sp. C35]|uniref:hypothetical protein n=1 Tax=Paraburkholderia sp. C35 TaxID=2126993 RepID=UPI000D6938E5|nr:hypothetical protein [Paraburkholderia sp. C35]
MISTGNYLKTVLGTVQAMGDKAISSDGMFVPVGYEDMRLLCKQFPQPVLSSNGEIPIPGPLGTETFQSQQAKINHQGQIAFYETEDGHVQNFIRSLQANGGRFDAAIYHGTMEQYKRGWRITDCFIQFEDVDRDWENRSQVILLSGTIFFHYTGDDIPGNI